MSMLSEHFALSEFMTSQTVARRGWTWPEISDEVCGNLYRLALHIGEPLREALGGQPIVISSGWRFDQLNRAVGGARNSAHVSGRAMDITVPGVSLRTVADEAVRLPECDKCILEFGPGGWVHVQIAREDARPRRRALCAYIAAGRTCYATGFEPPGGTWL